MVLPDLLGPGLRLVICGTAAGNRSAAVGHYYAGQGNRFWEFLWRSGLTPVQLAPEDDRRILEFGIGLTDVAKTASGGDAVIARSAYDAAGFADRIGACAPGWVAFHGKNAANVVARWRGEPGRVRYGHQSWSVAGRPVFVLPSASGAAQRPDYEGRSDRLDWFRELAELVGR